MYTPFKYKSLNFAHYKLPDIVQLFGCLSQLLFCLRIFFFCLRGNVLFITSVTVNQKASEMAVETLSEALGRLMISKKKYVHSALDH